MQAGKPRPRARGHDVDTYVGARVRERRKALRLSQIQLAAELGVAFQQVQKYELGKNRISASKLWEIGKALQAPVGWFFEGFREPGDTAGLDAADALHDFLCTSEALGLGAAFLAIPSENLRQRVLDLMKAMALEA